MSRRLPSGVTLIALLLAGCGSGPASRPLSSTQHATSPASTATTARPRRAKLRRIALHANRSRNGLPYSTASNGVVQRQPPAGTCHALGSGLYERPDPSCTPGALNPAVKQTTIDRTICVPGWTDTVRPPQSVTEQEKLASIAAYGDSAATGDYEYDHLVPLELGGATNDARNLWPEPGASLNPKDTVEETLRQEVCDRRISLARAQREIVSNWTSLVPPPVRHHSTTTGECNVMASYNSTYHDYDVYVHSNQPDQDVTVTDASGDSKSWHTDSTGYADVYLHAGTGASKEQIVVHAGTATCYGRL